ncbi:hydrolase [Psychroserpens sp. SPM9]|uniref:hydrolase n=1 Tax=Psychroserpens sp. SPM9 TaxID=2975598 RepID=UPI0021A31B23|nr:hydrolase [Psychroserpens sp. SPM9]MDG5491911.1 hydrolase [Psychroserpens sp. SPM9]
MKQRIFMYLFIFTLLLVIFQFVNSKNIIEDYDQKLTNSMEENTQLKDSIRMIADDKASDIYTFRFDTNDDAMTHWEKKGFRISEFVPLIKDGLMSLNEYETEDHPLVPFASMSGNKMRIDQIRMLNHKWIIISFTDGTYWGEMLLNYDMNNGNVTFKELSSLLYQP